MLVIRPLIGTAYFGVPNGAVLPEWCPPRSRNHTVQNLKDNASVAAVGIEMVLAVGIGLLIGQAVDDAVGTGPWATVFFVCVGFGAAFKAIIRTVKIIEKQLDAEDGTMTARPLRVARFDRRWS